MKTFKDEKDVKREVKRLLDAHEWFWWCPPANAYGKSGIADFHMIRGGVFIAIETKFGTNKPTAPQVGFLQSIQAESGFAFVVSDRNMEWFSQWLAAFDRAAKSVEQKAPVDDVDGAIMLNAIRALTELIK